MNSTQISITLSVAAMILALVSVVMQVTGSGSEKNSSADQAAAMSASESEESRRAAAEDTARAERESNLMSAAAQLEEKVARLERRLEGLNQLVRGSGLDVAVQMAGPGMAEQGPLFEQVGREAESRARFEKRREELNRQASESQYKDYRKYGPERYRELEELFRSARPGRGSQTAEDRANQTSALNRMIEEYPDSYSTSLAIAEQALSEALNGNAGQVETYLQTLRETSQHSNVVTDQGVEAVPNIQSFLARQYIEQNRIEDAVSLLDDLSESYPDSLIMEPPNAGGPPKPPRTATEVANELRQQLGTGN